MKLSKKLLIGTLIMSMVALGGCGKTKEASVEVTPTPSESVAPSESPKETEPEEKAEASKDAEKKEETTPTETATQEETASEVASDEIPIELEKYAKLEDLEGNSYRTKIPEGWTKGGDTKADASIDAYNVISNDKINGEIVITEQALEGADTIDMDAYMADHKKAYNAQSESTGVYVLDAGGKELDAVKIGYMKCEIKVTEQMVKNAITTGTVTQDEVDAAGGMDKYIAQQNTVQLQIYVPNKNGMITIATKLAGDHTSEIEAAAYSLANIMYLK